MGIKIPEMFGIVLINFDYSRYFITITNLYIVQNISIVTLVLFTVASSQFN